jgi:glycosyltransferase involved in cell wall biosynthesis
MSLVVLCRNERESIGRCLDSIVVQDYPMDRTEVLVVDGMSEDGTRDILRQYQARFTHIRLLDNSKRITPCAFNIGIKSALGSFVVVMSAHAAYPPDYVRICADTCRLSDAENVGGVFVTLPRGDALQARLVQALTTSRFGVGDAEYRMDVGEGPADTVPYGCFRREVFDEVGLFDERLVRNQDYEFNRRLKAAGKRIWLNPAIRVQYYNQATLGGLFRQAFGTGKWNPWMWYVAPYAFAARHAVPGLFVLGLFLVLSSWFLVSWGWIAAAVILVPYFALALLASSQQARRFGPRPVPPSSLLIPPSSLPPPSSLLTPHSSFLLFLPLPFLFFTYHVSYGLGTLWGAARLLVGATPVQRIREPWPGAGRYRAYQGRSQRSRAKSQESKPPKP